MTYKRVGEHITLEMRPSDYEKLLCILGLAMGAVRRMGWPRDTFYRILEFLNELNATNPEYTPYEIPEQYGQGKEADRV